jgi:hypothetical protein
VQIAQVGFCISGIPVDGPNGVALAPVREESSRFRSSPRSGKMMQQVRRAGVLGCPRPAEPSPALADYAGVYRSAELDSDWRLEPRGTALRAMLPRDTTDLRPAECV